MTERFIPAHGGYKNLLAFQKAEVVYDATVKFCAQFLDKRDRTVDQMVQAARSGKQNIVEGSMASGTSKESEIKLTNVARASLEELLTDYRDFLRVRGLRLWEKDGKEALYVRKLSRGEIPPPGQAESHKTHESHGTHEKQPPGVTFETFRPFFDTRPPDVLANIVICLIHQTNYLLDRQILRLEKDFVEQGGLRERMTRARLAERAKQGGMQ
ncbi:MAG: four helix bundle suffix domain-containing protein [Kiritimatiellia bacterium]